MLSLEFLFFYSCTRGACGDFKKSPLQVLIQVKLLVLLERSLAFAALSGAGRLSFPEVYIMELIDLNVLEVLKRLAKYIGGSAVYT